MTRQRVYRAYKTERNVADALKAYWPHASVGRGPGKDIFNVPFDIEVKARADFKPLEWLRQVTKRTQGKELSAVVSRMNGQGDSAEEYLAFMRFGDLIQLLVKAGYADFQSDTVNLEPERCNKCGSWIIKDSPCRTCEPLS